MPDDFKSIEDLLVSADDGQLDEDSIEGKFAKKQQEIKNKEIEVYTQRKSGMLGYPYIDLHGFPISAEALSLVDEEEAKNHNTVCFFYDGEKVRLASTNPQGEEVENILNNINEERHTSGKVYLISKNSLEYALKQYAFLPKVKKIIKGVEIGSEDIEKYKQEISHYKNLDSKINNVNITDVVTLILAAAIKTNSSDAHIEAEEGGIIVRFRIDGVLHDAATIDKDKWRKIISRIKLLAKVKINIEDKPQDGRFSIFLDSVAKNENNVNKIDVRCSFLPTSYGESVVMRILRSDAIGLEFNQLGLRQKDFQLLEREIKKPNGLILTTGPTGSGKTTTLYAILNKLNTENTKIITLENPIEYQLQGINQSQIDEKKGYTFSKGLRSILRQDPDIVMVGEIRDLETAEISIQASLTGHLVLSTLHTNDASGVIPRLIDMGVKSYFLTPSINVLIGQRLIRKLCDHCKEEHVLNANEEGLLNKILSVISPKAEIDIPSSLPKIYKKGVGCKECSGIGYKGRVGIYEIMTMGDDIKELADQGAPSFKILHQAIQNGMVTMLQDGILKALDGVTSLDEIYRVIGKFDYIENLYDIAISQTIGRGIIIQEEDFLSHEMKSLDFTTTGDLINNTNPKDLIKIVMLLALRSEAGDIHIEPGDKVAKIRYRIDGILHDVAEISKEHYIHLLSSVKVVAGIATNVKRATIDSRFSVTTYETIGHNPIEKRIDCRLSIISGGYGETIVIRILSTDASSLDFENLGINSYVLDKINSSISKTRGIIIATGPTGSGKTTTLYSAINQLNKPDVKIMTIEDPIEYHLEGVLQTQIDNDRDYTFAAAIRSFMRQNPNIIMVGEIRDNETAKVAIEAALTGHLVLSTIHANSAAGAIIRFGSLGIDRQALAGSLECSIGQRLARRVCQNCKKEIKLNETVLQTVKNILKTINPASGVIVPKELKFYAGAGCSECSGIGYKGRIGIYEVINLTENIQKLMQEPGTTNFDIEKVAMEEGTILMLQDGILKALDGKTTVDEVLRLAS